MILWLKVSDLLIVLGSARGGRTARFLLCSILHENSYAIPMPTHVITFHNCILAILIL